MLVIKFYSGFIAFKSECINFNINATVWRAMDQGPLTCTLETELDEVRRMMLVHHARYMPVIDKMMLMGVISFYDVAKAVVDSQNFENKMLKAYINDWPADEASLKS